MTDTTKLFSVLMSFLNEGDEVRKTVESVRQTAGDNVDIVVVNDCSDDGYDYESDLKDYNVIYYKSETRIGSSLGKEKCVELCKTPYFIILDAHCRFYTENWLDIATHVVTHDEDANKTIYCCAVQYFFDDTDHQTEKHPIAYGGFFNYNIKSLFSIAWNLVDMADNGQYYFEIPAILGANYIASKEWWNFLKGYQGLRLYGREEAYISLKSYMSGGKCKCISTIKTGHKGRAKVKCPYLVNSYEIIHNEYAILLVCNPKMFKTLCKAYVSIFYGREQTLNDANVLLYSHYQELIDLRKYLDSNKIMTYNEFDTNINQPFQRKINFSYTRQSKIIEGSYNKYQSKDKKIFSNG